MLSHQEWTNLTPEQRADYFGYVFEQAAYTEMGRRAGYLVATADFDQAAVIGLFAEAIRMLMANGSTLEEAVTQLAEEHRRVAPPPTATKRPTTITEHQREIAKEAMVKGQDLIRELMAGINRKE